MANSVTGWHLSDDNLAYMRDSAVLALRHYGEAIRGWCSREVGAAELKCYRDILYCLQQYVSAVNMISGDRGSEGCSIVLGPGVDDLAV